MTHETCAAQHYGFWAAQSKWLSSTISAYNAGALPKVMTTPDDEPLYAVDSRGIGLVSIDGQITKGESSFGGTSSTRTRHALRSAAADHDVKAIMLHIDSPGGTVAGLQPLADEVYAIAQSGKLIHTHADDMMASAALWVGIQANHVTASAMTEVGSIGVVAMVQDTSGAAEQAGVKVHVISTGEHKGAFAPGAEVTDDHLAELQSRVDEINTFFAAAVKRGAGLSIEAVRSLADGRDWLAAEAKDKGLIDGVATFDDAMMALHRQVRNQEREVESASRSRRIAMAKLT